LFASQGADFDSEERRPGVDLLGFDPRSRQLLAF
jgi:hypothetical protein